MTPKIILFFASLILVSCSTTKSVSIVDKEVIDAMFYEQAKYNDLLVTEYLLSIDTSKKADVNFTSFEVMFFLNKLRESKNENLLNLLQKSNRVYSIEYVYNRELYAHYWSQYENFSLKRTSFANKTDIIQDVSEDIPDFELIKQRINEEDELGTILDNVRAKYDYVHEKSTYVLSKYEFKNDKIIKSAFAIR